MFNILKVVAFICAMGLWANAAPADDDKKQPEVGNLKFTFGSKDEIPAAFFESAPVKKNANESSITPTSTEKATIQRRAYYPACQDGSGGMCVSAGSCPSNLKPERNQPGACASGSECCFGPPTSDKSCRSRGGECMPTKQCGPAAPKFPEAEDCDQKSGQICCILI